MSFETFFNPDDLTVEKEEILGKLEKGGLTDAIREEIIEWRKKREEVAMASPAANEIVRLNYEMAQIYEYADDINEMFNSLDDALQNAIQEGFADLEEMIRARRAEMEEKYPV